MKLDTAVVDALLPIVSRLACGESVPDHLWDAVAPLPAVPGVLQNGSVTLPEWRQIWEAAARGEEPALGLRQQMMLKNARAAIEKVSHMREIAAAAAGGLEQALADSLETMVRPNLPPGTPLEFSVSLVLGSCSGGFFIDDMIFIDLNLLGHLAADRQVLTQFMAHEFWHIGHGTAAGAHPRAEEAWFGPFFQLQTEGIANRVIGGTHEEYRRQAASADDAETRRRAAAFVAYAESFGDHAAERLTELAQTLMQLMDGDAEPYRAYARSLPDVPGYLHGLYMARAIDEVLGRPALIATVPDPLAFVLAYQRAAEAGGHPLLSTELMRRI